jgi:hypothetical protein
MDESNAQPQYTDTDPEKTAQDTTLNGGHQPSGSERPSASPSLEVEKVKKPAANPWTDPKSFPDGGAKGWLTVAGASACLFVSFGWINCVGIFQDYYQTHQLKQYSPSNIAWIPALQGRPPPFQKAHFANDHSLLHVVWWAICRQDFR